MTLREMRSEFGMTQHEFSQRYGIPFRTVQNWETGLRTPPNYLVELLEYKIKDDLVNRKTCVIPEYDTKKFNLPDRSKYTSVLSWLNDVSSTLGGNIVFALDSALMCEGSFLGRNKEHVVWLYGEDSLSRYNGVVVLGNHISKYQISTRGNLHYTNFSRTLNDSFANEPILDMQGITEALSRYYYKNNESFEGISVSPRYQERFESLANEAITYYDS